MKGHVRLSPHNILIIFSLIKEKEDKLKSPQKHNKINDINNKQLIQ
jgi:hypothetical protein